MYKKFKTLLVKYHKGTSTSTEKSVVNQFFDALQVGGITSEEVYLDKALHQRLYRKVVPKKTLPFFKLSFLRYTAIAASFACVGLLYFFFLMKSEAPFITQQAKKGEQLVFYLSDSTLVYLSGGSSMQYPIHFDDKQRVVQLQGEAFFEVKRTNPHQPFLVQSENLHVKVLGTKFNVNDIKGETISVSVHEGKVQVSDVEETKQIVLGANEKVDFKSKQQQFFAYAMNEKDLDQWHRGNLKFRQATIQEVIHVVNRRLNTRIIWQGEETPTLTITGDFKYRNMEEILNSLHFLYGIVYTKKGDGTIEITMK